MAVIKVKVPRFMLMAISCPAPSTMARVRWRLSLTMPYRGTPASAVPASASLAAFTWPRPPSISSRSGFSAKPAVSPAALRAAYSPARRDTVSAREA